MDSNQFIEKIRKHLTPMRVIFLSYVLIILVGGSLLYLPAAQAGDTSRPFLDCVFTATSAVCVTGLVVAPTFTTWTLFGQIVIIGLIQIGGLGMITITGFLFIITGRKLGFKDRILIQNSLGQNHMGGIARLTKLVIKGTLIFEGIGASILCLYFFFVKKVPFLRALYYGIFHAISAFCNAGFDVLEENSLVNYSGDIVINLVLICLIVTGGIGFFVWKDIAEKLKNRSHRVHVTTKIALYTTLFLILGGTLYFFLSEHQNPNSIGTLPTWNKWLASLFQSVTLRTAGFATIEQSGLKESSKLMSAALMMIGGSPGSIAGGIKTVTVAVIVLSIWSTIRGREQVVVMNRSVSLKTVQRALAVAGIMSILLLVLSTVVSITEAGNPFPHSFIDIIYECASALATVGNTTGITPYLSTFGKMAIISGMFVGRIGPITAIYSLARPKSNESITLPEAEVLIG